MNECTASDVGCLCSLKCELIFAVVWCDTMP